MAFHMEHVSVVTETLRLQRTPGDGRCMYASVAAGLGIDVEVLFARFMQWLRVAPLTPLSDEIFKEKLPSIENVSTGAAYADLLQARWRKAYSPERWGEHLELPLLAEMLGHPIYVYFRAGQINGRPVVATRDLLIYNKDAAGKPILVLFTAPHYDALVWSS